MTEIYYIEDDENIAIAVKEYLSQKGYAVSIFGTLKSGKKALERHIYMQSKLKFIIYYNQK